MPRTARICIGNAFYLVSTRAGGGLLLFRDAPDYSAFVALVPPLLAGTGLDLRAWCLLPGSATLLLHGEGEEMKRFTRLLLGRYSRVRTDVRGSGTGLYGGGRYSSRAFDDESRAPSVIRYVHSLPSREGIVLFPEAWEWSSLRRSIGAGGRSAGRSGMAGHPVLPPDPGEPEPDWREFEIRRPPEPAVPSERLLPADPAAVLAREYGVHRARLVNPRGRAQQALRHEAFRECRRRWGMNYSEVARAFGVTPSAVICALRRMEGGS
ncbi:MAG: hypothetical protein QUS11_01815 [Candidatus Fermentibacter sp.]|nr:hypothetical protein [Candidatus Fermentibacter sp.]